MKVRVITETEMRDVNNVVGIELVGKSLHIRRVTGSSYFTDLVRFVVYDIDEKLSPIREDDVLMASGVGCHVEVQRG